MVSRFNRTVGAIVGGVAASVIFLSSPATAQESPIVVTGPGSSMHIERVPVQDLNLASRDGERTLYRRVSNAVERVCLHDQGRWYGMTQPDFVTCTEGAWRGARPQMVGMLYRARQLAYYRR